MSVTRLGKQSIEKDAALLRTLVSGAGGSGGTSDHGALTGLSDDDHSQYVHNTSARTITAQHTFNPTSVAPFVVGASASGILVTGLNADLLDGQHSSYFLTPSNLPTYVGDGLTWDAGDSEIDVASTLAGNNLDWDAVTPAIDLADIIDIEGVDIGGTGRTSTSLVANSGYVTIGDKTAGHLSLDGDELQAKSTGTTTNTLNLNRSGGNVLIGPNTSADIHLNIGNTSNAGALGIGVTSPSYGLHLRHTTSPQVRIEESATDYLDIAVDGTGIVDLTATGARVDINNPLHLTSGTDVDLTADSGYLIIGNRTGQHITIDDNEIQSKISATSTSPLSLNREGGRIEIGGDVLKHKDYVSQTTQWGIDSGAADFRYIYADELHTEAFIADLEQALAGGQIICKSVTLVHQDFTLPTAGNTVNVVFKDLPSAYGMAVFEAGDIVRFRQFSRSAGSLTISDAWGTVATYSDGGNGTQSWNFTRSTGVQAGTATGTITADSIVLDYGTSGNGTYEVNAIDGVYAQNSPYAQITKWTTHPYDGETVRVRMGNLRGITSTADEYGLFAGEGLADTDQYFILSDDQAKLHNLDINMYKSGNQTVSLSSDGDLSLGTNVGAAATTNFSHNTTTGETILGAVASGKGNIRTVSGLIEVRTNTTEKFRVDSSGTLSLGSNVDTAAERFLTAFGTATAYNGESFQPGDILIWNNNSATDANILLDQSDGRIKFRGGQDTEAYIDTDGTITAGGGDVTLNTDGVKINIKTSFGDAPNSIDWMDGSSVMARLHAYNPSSTETHLYLIAGDSSYSEKGYVTIEAGENSTGGSPAKIEMIGGTSTTDPFISIESVEVELSNKLLINETANSDQDYGLTIKQPNSYDHMLSLKRDGFTHSWTAYSETDTFMWANAQGTNGGLDITTFTNTVQSLRFFGYADTANTVKTNSANAPFEFIHRDRSSTVMGDTPTNANLAVFKSRTSSADSAVVLFDKDGDIYYDGSLTAMDTHNDAMILRGYTHLVAPDTIIKNKFDQFVNYFEDDLIELGILGGKLAEGGLTCLTRLVEGLIGDSWQSYTRVKELEERVNYLEDLINGYKGVKRLNE